MNYRTLVGITTVGLIGLTSTMQAVAQSPTPMKLAIIPILTAAPIFVGQKEGYFKSEGIALEVTRMQGGALIAQAIVAGSIDAGEAASVPFMISTARGAKLNNACTFLELRRTASLHGIVAAKDSGIKSAADLRGKTVAVHTLGSLEDIRLRAEVLPAAGLKPADLKIVEVPFPIMENALKAKQVHAVLPFEPFYSALQNSGYAVVDNLSGYIPASGYPLDTYLFSTAYLEKNQAAVNGFKRAVGRAIQYIDKNPDQAADLTAAELKLPPALVRQALKNFSFNANCQHNVEGYRQFAAVMKRAGVLPEAYDPAPFLK